MKELIKQYKKLWAEYNYKDAGGVDRVKYWLTGDVSSTDAQAFLPYNGKSLQLGDTTYVIQVRQAGEQYKDKSGIMVARKANGVELRQDTRKYVDLGSMMG
tara:strand:+ start:864 stop:1166 length:303 start_codon:yes stop_codon:yes gene_type:complete